VKGFQGGIKASALKGAKVDHFTILFKPDLGVYSRFFHVKEEGKKGHKARRLSL